MPICIECCYPVPQLYHVLHSRGTHAKTPTPTPKPSVPNLSKPNASGAKNAGESALKGKSAGGSVGIGAGGGGVVGSDVRLTQCPRCKRFADKYVEHDYVVLFIDLVLVKPQVYRHLLFNLFNPTSTTLSPSILRLGTLLLLFDVYLTWSHIESLPAPLTAPSPIPHLNIFLQYLFYLFLCSATTLAQHLTIRWLAAAFALGDGSGVEGDDDDGNSNNSNNEEKITAEVGINAQATPAAPPRAPTPNAVSTALFVSSCMSLFPILTVVWKYGRPPSPTPSPSPSSLSSTPSPPSISSFLPLQSPSASVDWVRRGVSWAVAVQNVEALRILLGCGYLSACGLVGAGGAVRWVVGGVVRRAVGLDEG
ncbi:sterol homeostasis protein [Puttea exsequens]|nr:sterol homeostasis protein [Puttea exsequens]